MSSPEAVLQSKIVIKFSQYYQGEHGYLIGYMAKADNVVRGMINNSLGLAKNASDLFWIKNGELTGIELKVAGSRHNRIHIIGQADWLLKIPKAGYFCDSEEMFFSIINGSRGIDPERVRENCMKLKTVSVSWDEVRKWT